MLTFSLSNFTSAHSIEVILFLKSFNVYFFIYPLSQSYFFAIMYLFNFAFFNPVFFIFYLFLYYVSQTLIIFTYNHFLLPQTRFLFSSFTVFLPSIFGLLQLSCQCLLWTQFETLFDSYHPLLLDFPFFFFCLFHYIISPLDYFLLCISILNLFRFIFTLPQSISYLLVLLFCFILTVPLVSLVSIFP